MAATHDRGITHTDAYCLHITDPLMSFTAAHTHMPAVPRAAL